MSENKKKFHGWKWQSFKCADRLLWIECTVPPGAWGNPSGKTFSRREYISFLHAKKEDQRYWMRCVLAQIKDGMQFGLEFQGYGGWLV